MTRLAETSSIERLSKIKVFASIEVFGKNATLANFPTVGGNVKNLARNIKCRYHLITSRTKIR